MAKETKETKSKGQKLADKLFFNLKNCWEGIDEKTEKEVEEFAVSYKQFLDKGKTERECAGIACELLEKNGFVNIDTLKDRKFKSGMKIYQNIRGKSILAAVIGSKPVTEGCNILGAHIDSPRLDLKQNPLYEDSDFALFDTHYYGGIKKYQWTAIPLSMHGVFVDENGKKQVINIGEEPGDPVFTITDLLPHLAREQMEKKASEAVEGENLDILTGSRPFPESSTDKNVKEKIKLNILALLNERYGITEKDFASAEIEFVPAFKASDVGLDRSMIGSYGHDDRCCAFPALKAIIALAKDKSAPDKTVICYLSDKEETGSAGNTGARSSNFENFIAMLCAGEADLRLCFSKSAMLSADVNAAFDPTYAGVFDKRNSSFMGKGIALEKYTGSGGKYGASDANAEFCARVQAVMTRNKIQWQFGELGKVDKGGGGTIALYAANLGIDVLDCGIPVLSMHSPFEVISKIDLYTTYKGYIAFLREI
uniref:M18 family aminopeptidase n=1 Tax=uncultured bacterium contig00037 TaxID=1181525 RepID=A0A806KJR5_9BACT|nr:peptidase M18, aminopeptidase I [uncultured bacterium contig00037]